MADSNMLLVIMRMEDVDKAKALANSENVKERMKKAGVIGKPSFDYIEVVMNDNSIIPQTARLMVKHKVKDPEA
jgi:hypothetical protein